jgi:hypothetical protein
VTDKKLNFSGFPHCNVAVKGDACAWKMLHVLAFHTVEYEHQMENVFVIYIRFYL